jgi:DNA-binding transcriptional MerR regulator
MEKYRAIPPGFMTVGQLAKKMNTTVRTLQYYDKEGLLSPSCESEGGRRLYTDKDIIRLHQIQSMKYLGFSLDDIKNRLVSLETPADVAGALAGQAKVIREKIASLSDILQAIEKLQEETLQMQTVDFEKYADIVVNLQLKNEFYGIIKYFDDKTLDHIHSRFGMESGAALVNTISCLFDEAAEFLKNGITPQSQRGQEFAKAWWDMVMEFTGGDMSLLPSLMKLAENPQGQDGKFNEKWSVAEPFVTKALEEYFTNLGYNPFEGVEQ